ncbi:MAG: hypothetical protein V1792_23495 [Pseudomonadota bacterium]
MRSLLLWPVLLATVAGMGTAFGCTKLEKDLARLRKEFHRFASTSGKDGTSITFEDIAEKLDKIVDIKNEMRKKGCKIPPRTKPWESD